MKSKKNGGVFVIKKVIGVIMLLILISAIIFMMIMSVGIKAAVFTILLSTVLVLWIAVMVYLLVD